MTNRQHELLALVRKGLGEHGIYALAARLGRPYRRVFDNVRALEAEGFVRTVRRRVRGRTVLAVLPPLTGPKPHLQFQRQWSAPGVDLPPATIIAGVLSRPTFRDLVSVAQAYGLPAVHQVYRTIVDRLELPASVAAEDARMLSNIEVGFARAAR